jgi:hypothetical protein
VLFLSEKGHPKRQNRKDQPNRKGIERDHGQIRKPSAGFGGGHGPPRPQYFQNSNQDKDA